MSTYEIPVLTIAGSDSSGGAGIQADLKVFSANKVYGMSVITSVTAQNTKKVYDVENISPDIIREQIKVVFEDIRPAALKIGMLSTKEIIDAVADELEKNKAENIVLDTVMISKSGYYLLQPDAVKSLKEKLLPIASVVTPNIPEAEELSGMKIKTVEDIKKAAEIISACGPEYVLIKGGHLEGDSDDYLFGHGKTYVFPSKRIDSINTHGTGCSLSAAIASFIAKGYSVVEAVEKSKKYITEAIEQAYDLGHGCGPVNHFYKFDKTAGEIATSMGRRLDEFSSRNEMMKDFTEALKLYLVTDSEILKDRDFYEEVENALKGGVRVVQLREKNLGGKLFTQRAVKLRELTNRYNAYLIINDRVDIAMISNADGIHIGQSDIDAGLCRTLVGEDMIIGVSAKTVDELEKAQNDDADYIGVGAAFSTSTKKDAEVGNFDEFVKIGEQKKIPAVLIGGINLDNICMLKELEYEGYSIISGILKADDVEGRVKEFFNLI